MSCPVCDHTMQATAPGIFWCPRCGTIREQVAGRPDHTAPRLVDTVREVLRDRLLEYTAGTVEDRLAEQSLTPEMRDDLYER